MIRKAENPATNSYDQETYTTPLQRQHDDADISFVIPVFNEEESLEELAQRIDENVPAGMNFEIIFIDDGSTDDSWIVIQALSDITRGQIRGLRFRANRGKAAGLQAGFKAAQGGIIFTMDADLQDDPKEIPCFLAKLEEGYDLVSGWKKVRHDPWHKVWPSRIFNRLLSYFSNVKLHDHNCGFKCYRQKVAKSTQLFGELHRMVPALAGMNGFRVTEIPVRHHARRHGYSKYGVERFVRGFSDMLTIGFLRKYSERPAHFANTWAASCFALATLLAVGSPFVGLTSVQGLMTFFAGLFFFGFGGALFLAGLIAELVIRQNRRSNASDHVCEVVQTAPRKNVDVDVVTERKRIAIVS